MAYGGLRRSYLVVAPIGVAGPLPLIIDLSGRAVSASYEAARMDWQAVTTRAVIVFPSDVGLTWDAGNCCGSSAENHVDDIGFLEAVTARVLATVSVADPARVYLAGYSNGGKMALDLACQDPDGWKAVAVYGATATAACPDFPATSLQVGASTGDPELTMGPGSAPHSIHGFPEPTVDDQVTIARRAADCSPQDSTSTAGALTTTTWSCAAGRQVALAVYSGGSHSWPQPSGETPGATATMWQFFVSQGA